MKRIYECPIPNFETCDNATGSSQVNRKRKWITEGRNGWKTELWEQKDRITLNVNKIGKCLLEEEKVGKVLINIEMRSGIDAYRRGSSPCGVAVLNKVLDRLMKQFVVALLYYTL